MSQRLEVFCCVLLARESCSHLCWGVMSPLMPRHGLGEDRTCQKRTAGTPLYASMFFLFSSDAQYSPLYTSMNQWFCNWPELSAALPWNESSAVTEVTSLSAPSRWTETDVSSPGPECLCVLLSAPGLQFEERHCDGTALRARTQTCRKTGNHARTHTVRGICSLWKYQWTRPHIEHLNLYKMPHATVVVWEKKPQRTANIFPFVWLCGKIWACIDYMHLMSALVWNRHKKEP